MHNDPDVKILSSSVQEIVLTPGAMDYLGTPGTDNGIYPSQGDATPRSAIAEDKRPWEPWRQLRKVKFVEGNSLFNEELGLHLLTRMVPPGDRRPIPIAPKELDASIRKHL